ncbi:MAG: formylglycine-generating enzyme family protein [Treponema sp.]|jgi:formylglycine-generating enzyme required for sulfatase activity|nr:formylglycine-generating enzyme family protein [Treponema sp.]
MKFDSTLKRASAFLFLLLFTLGTVPGREGFEGPKMISVRGGTFFMGSNEGSYAFNEKVHKVSLGSFLISETEVTQGLYESVMSANPSHYKGAELPVENVSWFDAVRFCNALSLRMGLPAAYTIEGEKITWNREAKGFRLPTESEWEYAARGGPQGAGSEALEQSPYAGGTDAEAYCWYRSNSGGRTQQVKTKLPNQLGLYDMSGNVWEWCWDWHNAYPDEAASDPDGGEGGRTKIMRGGAWFVTRNLLRVTFRVSNPAAYRADSLGFRVAQNG